MAVKTALSQEQKLAQRLSMVQMQLAPLIEMSNNELEERVELAAVACRGIPNVEVRAFKNLLVDFAHEVGAAAIVKGLRVVTDFESEFQQSALNYRMSPDLETLFIMSAPEHMYLSSSLVREIAQLKGNLMGFVPPNVGAVLVERFGCTYE